MNKKFYTYILRCTDNSLYTGITNDVERRMQEHFNQTKECAKYTKNHKAQKLEAVWKSNTKSLASKLEFHIKKLTKQEKENLILTNVYSELLLSKIDAKEYERIK